MSGKTRSAKSVDEALERRLKGLAAFIAAFETEHGEITDEELAWAKREARRRTTRMRR